MSQGNDFVNYSAASSASPGGAEEVWFVAVASDDIKQMTIDQLDEAFRLGVITGETPVWTEGMEAWAPLAQVADLEGDSGADASAADTSAAGQPQNARQAADGGSFGAPSTGSFPVAGNYPANGSSGTFGAVTMQSVQHSFAPGPNSFAPVTSSYAPSPIIGHSQAPITIGSDDDLPPVKRSGGLRPARWAIAGAAAALVIGVIAYNNLSSSVASAGTEAAPAPSLAARPYDGADGAEKGAAPAARAAEAPAAAEGGATVGNGVAPSNGAMGGDPATGAAAASTTAKAALVAPSDDAADEPSKKSGEKDSLKSTFSKSLTKKEKASSKSAKVKPRKTASRASTKSRATKAKKSTVVRSQSAFDPLNDSLP